MNKQETFTLRLSREDLETWNFYAASLDKSTSEFVRDCVNALIKAKKVPSKIYVIENKEV